MNRASVHGFFSRLLLAFGALGVAVLATAGMQTSEGSNNVSASNATKRLVIIGASYAAGWKQPQLPGFAQVINKGVGGEETHQVRARFERDALAPQPSTVLLWGHINNIHRAPKGDFEAAKERAKDDYRAMVAMARDRGVAIILGTEVTLSEAVGWKNRLGAFVGRLRGKQGYNARINEHVRSLNAWLRDYARQERIAVLDFEKAFDDGEGFRKVEFSTDDGSHITAEGYAELTRYARAQLQPR